MRHVTTIPNEAFFRCVTPAMMHGLLGRSGVVMEKFTHGGIFQPVNDWIEHEMRDNIAKPWTILPDVKNDGVIIIQDIPEQAA